MGLSELIKLVGEWAQNIVAAGGYPGLFLVMVMENLFPPIPSEILLPFAGFIAHETGQFSLAGITVVGSLGSVVGALVFYALGAAWGEHRIRAFIDRFGRYAMISAEDFDKALAAFQKYGLPIIFFGRFIPIIRTLISLPAGVARIPLAPFVLYTALGTGLWSFILGFAGLTLGSNWETILEFIDQYETMMYVVLIAAAGLFVASRIAKRLRREPETAKIEIE